MGWIPLGGEPLARGEVLLVATGGEETMEPGAGMEDLRDCGALLSGGYLILPTFFFLSGELKKKER